MNKHGIKTCYTKQLLYWENFPKRDRNKPYTRLSQCPWRATKMCGLFCCCYKSNEANKGLLNNSVQDQNPRFATCLCQQWSEEKVCVQRCWLCGPWGRMFIYNFSHAPRAGPAFLEALACHSTSALAIWSAESRSGCWNRRPAGFSTSAVPMREYKAVLEMETSGGWAASLCGTVFNFKKWTLCFWQRKLHSSSHEWVSCMVLKQRTLKVWENAKTNEQGNAGYNLWQSIVLHLHRLTKRLVAEASRAPGLWSQACLVPVYHCCLSDTEAFSHGDYLPRPPSSRHHFQNKSLMVNNAEFYSMFALFWITTDLMVSVRPSTFQFRGHRLALFESI